MGRRQKRERGWGGTLVVGGEQPPKQPRAATDPSSIPREDARMRSSSPSSSRRARLSIFAVW